MIDNMNNSNGMVWFTVTPYTTTEATEATEETDITSDYAPTIGMYA